jgi:signal transduction histidine kinase
LAGRIVLTFLGGAVILLVLDGILAASREREFFEDDAEADARLLGRALKVVVADVWKLHGEQEALRLLEDVDRERSLFEIRWLWIEGTDAAAGERPSLDVRQSLAAGEDVVQHRRRGPDLYLETYLPLRPEGGRLGAIVLAEDLSPLERATQATVVRIVVLTIVLSLMALVLAVPVGIKVIGRPLTALVEKTRRIGREDFSGPLDLSGHDELSELAAALNTMCDRLTESRERLEAETEARIGALQQLRHEDRLRTVGRLASGVAHELGTPLNVVQGRAELIARRRLGEDEVVRAAETIKAQAKAIASTVRQLLDFARVQAPRKAAMRPREIVDEVVELLRPMARRRGASLRVGDDGSVDRIQADRNQIHQVLTNLVMNAIEALNDGGEVEIGLSRASRDLPHARGSGIAGGDFLRLIVQDTGEGIAEKDLPHVFEPFFTTRDVGEGTGLGLAIAHGIVREHGGWTEASSRLGEGSRFSVFLPLGDEEQKEAAQ